MPDYLEELNKLPQEIQDILISPFGAVVNAEIINKYKMDNNQSLKFIYLVNDIYLKTLTVDDLPYQITKSLDIKGKEAKELAADIAGLKLLVAKDYFKIDIESFINNMGGNIKRYLVVLEKIKESLIKEREEYEKNVAEEKFSEKPAKRGDLSVSNRFPSVENEKKDSIELFKNGLVDALDAGNSEFNEILSDYNLDLIAWFDEDSNFRKEIERTLFLNKERIGSQDFIIDGKKGIPTISNWIQNFIKLNGSGMFDNVVLSRYMINSPNAKILDLNEKRLLTKLLVLYRNLKFFPESMEGVPPEEREIIPIEREQDVKLKARAVSGPPKTIEEKEIDALKQAEENYQPGGIERMALEEEISEKKQVDHLRALAKRYKEGSLERKAIEEEIKKLGN